MGAATALMHGERDPSIACMVLDSPFADLTQLADEIIDKGKEHGLNVPKFVTRIALRMIKSSVQSRAGFSIQHLTPVSYAPR
jgi:acetyl esterase/lipase